MKIEIKKWIIKFVVLKERVSFYSTSLKNIFKYLKIK